MNTSECLYSVLKNTSGGELIASCLPPMGKTLAANEEISIAGHVLEAILREKPKSSVTAFMTALTTGLLDIISTPAPILYDATADRSMALKLDNGILYMVDPCWSDAIFSSSL